MTTTIDNMTVTVENNKLTVVLDLQMPTPSSTGKTLIVATSGGTKKLKDIIVHGKPLTVGVNAFIPLA